MLDNFQLSAIVSQDGDSCLLRIPLHQELQDTLANSWQIQYNEFFENIEEIDFDVGYMLEQHERFRLRNYELPTWMSEEFKQFASHRKAITATHHKAITATHQDTITDDNDMLDAIKGVVATARNDQGEELILFQNFNRSHVIRPGRYLFLEKGTYTTKLRPGLTLDSKLSAIFLPTDSKLLFRNFRTTNTFLPLTGFNREASDLQIREILKHDKLVSEDADALVAGADQWTRKRFAMLRESQILDYYSVQEIHDRSKDYNIDIKLDGNQIVFPVDRTQVKRLLQFLNEEIFRGAITKALYETNSKRTATDEHN